MYHSDTTTERRSLSDRRHLEERRSLSDRRNLEERRNNPHGTAAKTSSAAEMASMRFAYTPRQGVQGVTLSQVYWRAVAETAYFKAEKRGFLGGFEIDDWVQAEQEIRLAME
jgi:hypothetical protein